MQVTTHHQHECWSYFCFSYFRRSIFTSIFPLRILTYFQKIISDGADRADRNWVFTHWWFLPWKNNLFSPKRCQPIVTVNYLYRPLLTFFNIYQHLVWMSHNWYFINLVWRCINLPLIMKFYWLGRNVKLWSAFSQDHIELRPGTD